MGELASFHDALFPTAVSFGATGGPERRNEIVLLTSGREQRNLRSALSRRSYDAGTGVRSLQDVYDIIAFFEARRGSFHAFRFRDPFDNRSCRPEGSPSPGDQSLGTGDGLTRRFALVKAYGGGEQVYLRPIRKPVVSTLRVSVAGVEKSLGIDFSFDDQSGEVLFAAAPPMGAELACGYLFDVPVRFDVEKLSISLTSFRAGQIPTIPLIEVLLP